MISLRFLKKRFNTAMFKKYNEAAKRISKNTNKSKLAILLDMFYCTFKYGSGLVDYESFSMFNMDKKTRESVLTISKNNSLVLELNKEEDRIFFEDKAEFNKKFAEFINRDWVLISDKKEDLKEFFTKHKKSIVKPLDESCGTGIELFEVNEDIVDENLVNKITKDLDSKGAPLAEEIVTQYHKMSEIYAGSVNTIRLVTILYNDKVNFIGSCLRMGRSGNFVDNFNSGGIAVAVDPKNGEIVSHAYDKMKNIFETHPDTGYRFKGQFLPNWDEILSMMEKAVRVVPTVRYVGWDICLDENGKPLLIEGNSYPGQDVTQFPDLKLGDYNVVKKALGRE